MKSVLISIQPKWCELIANGKKTVEVRKTRPKIETPFKCYIYCTKDKHGWFDFLKKTRLDGKVIGEFVCDRVYDIEVDCDQTSGNGYDSDWMYEDESACMRYFELDAYLQGKNGYGWHISNLVIYDKPKELSEFKKPCKLFKNGGCLQFTGLCEFQGMTYERYGKRGEHHRLLNAYACLNVLKRPPQSWCYVEELKGGAE